VTLRVCVSAYVRGVAQCVGGGKCFLFQGRWCLCAPCVCNTLLFFFFFFFHLLWDPGCDWRVVCVCVWCAYACACAHALMCVLFLCLYLCLSLSLSLNLMVFSYPLFFFLWGGGGGCERGGEGYSSKFKRSKPVQSVEIFISTLSERRLHVSPVIRLLAMLCY